MRTLSTLLLSSTLCTAQAQVEGVWEEYLVVRSEHHYIQNIEIVNINQTWLLMSKDKTFTFRKRRDGILVTDQNEHGSYYMFDKDNTLYKYDNDGRLVPEYVILDKIK